MPQSIVQQLSSHLLCRDADKHLFEVAKTQLADTKRQVAADWRRVRGALQKVLPKSCGMSVGLVQKNCWYEWFCSTEPGVVAYVFLQRVNYQWNRDVVPNTPVRMSPDERKVAQSLEDKILELGFALNHDRCGHDRSGGDNLTVWRVSLPTPC